MRHKGEGADAMQTAEELRASLTAGQRSMLAAIVAAPLAWTSFTRLANRFEEGEATIAELEALELVVRWELPTEEDMLTLTEWGQFVLGVEIDERLKTVEGFHVEVPFWVPAGKGSDAVVLPRYPKEIRMPFPERAADRTVTPKLLVDEVSGSPVTLFTGDGSSGVTVQIDPRLKGASRPQPRSQTDRYLHRSPGRSQGKGSMSTRTLKTR